MFSLFVIGFRNKAKVYYIGLHINGGRGAIFVTVKTLSVALCLILKNREGTGSLRYPELQSGLCKCLQITNCTRTRYVETYANKSYLPQLQRHQLCFHIKMSDL